MICIEFFARDNFGEIHRVQIPTRDQWTEVHEQLYEEFEQKEAHLKEEQEKYTKALEFELDKLKGEVKDLMNDFEKILKELMVDRNRSELRCYWQEVYSVRLYLALLQSVDDESLKEQMLSELEDARFQLREAEEALEVQKSRVRSHEKVIDEYSKRDRELVLNFKSQFPNLEPDAVSVLQKLFRQRPKVELVVHQSTIPSGRNSINRPRRSSQKQNSKDFLVDPNPFVVGTEEKDYNGENIDTLHVPELQELPAEQLRYLKTPVCFEF